MRLLLAIECAALLSASASLAADRKVCVPGEDRRWLCGDEADLRDRPAAPTLPPPATPLPPVLLIDPDRLFGPAPKRASPDAATAGSGRTAASEAPAATVTTAPARPEPAVAVPNPSHRGSHVWQLVRASAPGGFGNFLRARGIDPAETRTVQTRRGDWLLLYGDFPGIEAARAAKARVGAGFARAWADVESEL